MCTDIELDDELVQQALKISKLKTKTEVGHEALKLYVASLNKKQLLSLREKNTWICDLRQMREI